MPGFTGLLCETEFSIHPLCESQPCQNNGTCRVSQNSKHIECDCISGFTGARCEIDWNECESQPCMNGGECIDEIGTFRCNCSGVGYSGTICQNNVDECMIGTPCQNGGICFDTYGSYTCECQAGFAGQNCERQLVNECLTQPCEQGGTCVERKGGRFECVCPQGYSGVYCELGPPCPRECPVDTDCIGGKCVCRMDASGKSAEYVDVKQYIIILSFL